MDANGNADRDHLTADAVLRIAVRSIELGETLRFRQADGSTIGFSLAIGEGGISVIGPAVGPVVNVRARTGDADNQARQKHVDQVRNGATEMDLTKAEWSRGDPDDIRSCCEELLSALEVDRTLRTVKVGHHFLVNLGKMDQRRAFRAMLERPSLTSFSVLGSQNSPEKIHTSVLLEAMAESHNHLQNIILSDVFLTNRFDVEQLASALRAGCGGVLILALAGLIPISAEYSPGFLDPLLEATLSCQQPLVFSLCGYLDDDVPPSGLPSLLTTAALCSYLEVYANSTQPDFSVIQLHNLGLEDEHCKAIAELLAPMNGQYPEGKLISLWITGNGAFSDEGFEALLGLLNRNHCIQEIQVDDSSWQEAFDLMCHMNTKYGRGEFMEDGVFADKAGWVKWLAKLTNLPSTQDEAEETLRASALWYTLRNEPSFISN
jgi:hypothetical protein